MTAPVPIVGDIVGVAADARMFIQEPESRTWGNAALATGGALLPFVPNAAIFGGVLAKNADKMKLAAAQEMAAKNVDKTKIWQDTGWFQGADKKWRFEIDDSGAQFSRDGIPKVDTYRSGKLPDGYTHDKLYEAYPELKDTDLTSYGWSGDTLGGFRSHTDWLGKRYPSDITLWKGGDTSSVVSHEAAHNIQAIEGFARGGNPSGMTRADRLNPDYERVAPVMSEINDIIASPAYRAEREASNKLFSTVYEPKIDALDAASDSLKGADLEAIRSQIDGVFSDYKKLQKTEFPLMSRIDELYEPIRGLATDELLPEAVAYRRLAGEAEARNVQTRLNMTAAERRATPPWETFDVPESDQIVRFDGGEAMSIADDLDMSQQARMARAGEQGYLRDMYTGSTHDIANMDGSLSNPEADWGRGVYASDSIDDVNANYAGVGPDLTSRIDIEAERVADELMDWPDELLEEHGFTIADYEADEGLVAETIARKRLVGDAEGGVVYPVKIKDGNYAVIGGQNSTKIYDKDYSELARLELGADALDDDVWEYADELRSSDEEGLYARVNEALRDTDLYQNNDDLQSIMEDVQDSILDGELDLDDLDDAIRKHATYSVDDNGDLVSAGGISSQVLQNLGYDGVIDNKVYGKFGGGRAYGQAMDGLYPSTQHTITFPGKENTIRSVNAAFDPAKKDSSNLLAEVLGGAVLTGAVASERDKRKNEL